MLRLAPAQLAQTPLTQAIQRADRLVRVVTCALYLCLLGVVTFAPMVTVVPLLDAVLRRLGWPRRYLLYEVAKKASARGFLWLAGVFYREEGRRDEYETPAILLFQHGSNLDGFLILDSYPQFFKSIGKVRAPVGLRHAATAIASIAFLVLVLGTFVTAAGPHGGDGAASRIPVYIGTLTIAHAHGVWMLLGTSIVTLLIARQMGEPRLVRAIAMLVAISLAQGGVGYLQYWLGIPAELVSLHILGASLVWLATARLWVVAHRPDLKRPDRERAGAHEDAVTA